MKLSVQDLSFSFDGKKILDHLCLDVEEGEFIALVGPSGCGKSTLLNILAGLLQPDEGHIYVKEEEIKGISSHFAYMPQEDLLLPWKTILENVTLYGKLHGTQKEDQKKALQEFELFGLKGYEHAYPHECSGGMRQRAAFLRTALCKADILLLDEPFGALDVITRNEMQDWLLELRKKMKTTTVLVTHDIDEALYLADRILILSTHPASLVEQIYLNGIEKNRSWLYEQSELRKKIYEELRGGTHAS